MRDRCLMSPAFRLIFHLLAHPRLAPPKLRSRLDPAAASGRAEPPAKCSRVFWIANRPWPHRWSGPRRNIKAPRAESVPGCRRDRERPPNLPRNSVPGPLRAVLHPVILP